MQNILLAFITGLTTGGLSCLAVQGGLLASSLGSQIEKDIQAAAGAAADCAAVRRAKTPLNAALQNKGKKRRAGNTANSHTRQQYAAPIAAFLTAKILAYTLLGFLLGLVGSMFQLSPLTRAFLQIAIGIYMLGSALRMFNVHPIFRYFAFEPPAFLRRRIRKAAAARSAPAQAAASLATPALLGLLTVLIPCGITQAMMAAALGTGNPFNGAALMFAFTLGTSPVFFGVAYFATRLGSRLEKHFMRFVAVVMLILGFVSIDTGLTLAGSPVSFTRVIAGITAGSDAAADGAQAGQPAQPGQDLQVFDPNAPGPADGNVTAPEQDNGGSGAADGGVVTINIKNSGYSPRVVHAKAGVPLKLRLVSRGVYSCALAFIAPSLGVQEYLESTGEKLIDIPPQEKGAEAPFSCSMGMFTGTIIFDL